MKHLLLTTIAAVLLVGCGESPPDITIDDAARTGNIKAVKQHLAAGKDVNAKSWHERTPLHQAAAYGRKEIVELLIAEGADVNAKAVDGTTPLHKAARNGQEEVVELLIAKGADLNAKDKNGDTPLGLVIKHKQTVRGVSLSKLADLLRKHGGKSGEEGK